MRNIFTVDVEEYFHPTEVQRWVPMERWESLPPTVERNTERMLALMEKRRVKATCFVVGWVAERYPGLVRAIASAGHEIGCHSYAHRCVFDLTPEEFRADTMLAQDAIASACGLRPAAYRAPSFSINRNSLWALDVLSECGFTHDSSIYPVKHDRYGIPGFSRKAQAMATATGPILEAPPATAELAGGTRIPVGGGAYLRLLPYRYTAAGIRRMNAERLPAMVYTHPWELDPEIPRLAQGAIALWRTHTGLRNMAAKLDRLLGEFEFSTFADLYPCLTAAKEVV